MVLFLISNNVPGIFVELQIFWNLVVDRITRAFNTSGATQAVLRDISKFVFGKLIFFTDLGLIEFLVLFTALFPHSPVMRSFVSFWMESFCKCALLVLESHKAPFIFLTLFLWYMNDILHDDICNSAVCADGTTLYSKFDRGFGLWQQHELASKHKSDLWGIVYWASQCLVKFHAEKTHFVSFLSSR